MRGELPDDYEIALTSQFERHGDVFVDAGAHRGTWTVRLSPFFRRVIAFEPHPQSYEALMIEAPGNVEGVPFALGASGGEQALLMYDSPGHSALEGSLVMADLTPTGRLTVNVTSIDEWFDAFSPGKLDMLKIDTEGLEVEVLEGARRTLARDRPMLCVENHSVELREKALAVLAEIGLDDVTIWPDASRRHVTEGGYLIRL